MQDTRVQIQISTIFCLFLGFHWILVRSDPMHRIHADASDASDPWIRSIGSIQCIGSMDRVNRMDSVHRIQANNFFTGSKDGQENK